MPPAVARDRDPSADALIALGRPVQIAVDVAADGIDELLDNLPATRAFSPKVAELQGDGGRSTCMRSTAPDTDGLGEWLITHAARGIRVLHGHAKGDVAVRGGSISDLELLMYTHVSRRRLRGLR